MFRCHGESLRSIRKGLLRALNLQAEPQLPAGGLDSVREQWKSIFSTIPHRAKDAAGNWNPNLLESTIDFIFFQPETNYFGFFSVKQTKILTHLPSTVSLSMLFHFQLSLATLCQLMMKTVLAWSAVPWPLRSSWKVHYVLCVLAYCHTCML